jgi:hypothetical protein
MDRRSSTERMEMMDKQTLRKLEIDCLGLIISKVQHRLSPDEFYIKLMELHKKYPMEGHDPPLTVFQLSHYLDLEVQSKGEIMVDGKPVKWVEHIQPYNFQEASEMYIRNYHHRKDITLPPWLSPPKVKKEDRKARLPYKDDEDW